MVEKKRQTIKKEIVKKEPIKDVKKEEIKKYILCPFCKVKNYRQIGRDEASSWCETCGKCIPVVWLEEV